jgi:hypothetical protein
MWGKSCLKIEVVKSKSTSDWAMKHQDAAKMLLLTHFQILQTGCNETVTSSSMAFFDPSK